MSGRDAAVRRAEAEITAYLEGLTGTPDVLAVERDDNRWLLRLAGTSRDVTTIWFTLRERTLAYETQFLPAPQENLPELYEFLLLRNERLYGVHFALCEERDVFLLGQMPVEAVTAGELDRVVGTLYAVVEDLFPCALRLGYASLLGAAQEGDGTPEAGG